MPWPKHGAENKNCRAVLANDSVTGDQMSDNFGHKMPGLKWFAIAFGIFLVVFILLVLRAWLVK
jgi:hypothetical protein